MLYLETERLLLRDFCDKDITPYTTMTQDSKYQRFYSEEDCSVAKTIELARMFIQQIKEKPRTKYQLAIVHKESGQFIGTCGIRLENSTQASLGCGLARSFQTSGYAKEAAKALIRYAFDSLNIHRIHAETIGANRAAILLCQSLGMHQETCIKENRYFKNQWWDTVILTLLKNEWHQ